MPMYLMLNFLKYDTRISHGRMLVDCKSKMSGDLIQNSKFQFQNKVNKDKNEN